eukprot:TRINITY_DN6061_c0_g1_i1.p1 TRINITY_DN6061_c0_g1~~TRINITY_DN6061_c0_g1_i1.p1  ORF type:complete len:164 (+),score=27.22 TRINITY_DN6061_c0_g1_i1:82-573(+)
MSDKKPAAPWTEPNGVYHKYRLNCHCGATKHTITISPPLFPEHAENRTTSSGQPELFHPVVCNCSYCQRYGTIGVHLLPKDVTFERESKKVYQAGNKAISHWTCSVCGNYIGADISKVTEAMGAGPKYLINLRLLSDYDLASLPEPIPVTFMRNMPPKYEVPE